MGAAIAAAVFMWIEFYRLSEKYRENMLLFYQVCAPLSMNLCLCRQGKHDVVCKSLPQATSAIVACFTFVGYQVYCRHVATA
jgi:hypothetical protein